MSVINSATDDQMAESDSCYVVDGKLLYQGTKRRNGKKKEKKKRNDALTSNTFDLEHPMGAKVDSVLHMRD